MTPQHYTQTIEPASRLPKEDQPAFWKGQIIKYFSRAGLKEGVPFEDDFAKGLHCVERYKECLQEVVPASEPTPADTPKYMTLGHFVEVPEGYNRIDTAGPFEPDDLVVVKLNGAYQCVPYETWGGKELPFGIALRKAAPTYRDLGPHTIPDGYRQLADNEVIKKGDVFNSVHDATRAWDNVRITIGSSVASEATHLIFARPCTPPPTPPQS